MQRSSEGGAPRRGAHQGQRAESGQAGQGGQQRGRQPQVVQQQVRQARQRRQLRHVHAGDVQRGQVRARSDQAPRPARAVEGPAGAAEQELQRAQPARVPAMLRRGHVHLGAGRARAREVQAQRAGGAEVRTQPVQVALERLRRGRRGGAGSACHNQQPHVCPVPTARMQCRSCARTVQRLCPQESVV
jgi:hypothetical protein